MPSFSSEDEDRFTSPARSTLERASQLAFDRGHPEIDPEHILAAMLEDPNSTAYAVLRQLHPRPDALARRLVQELDTVQGTFVPGTIDPYYSPDTVQALSAARDESGAYGDTPIGTEHLLLGIVAQPGTGPARWLLRELGIDSHRGHQALLRVSGGAGLADFESNDFAESSRSPLELYGRDLTDLARRGKLDPVVGRHAEMQRVIGILLRRTKNNPVLVGEPGVGKTAIAHGLAQLIASNEVPSRLREKRLISIELTRLTAGARNRGELEERFARLLTEVHASTGEVILFVDELFALTRVGTGDGASATSSILKQLLARDDVRCVGATTPSEYRTAIERDPTLERRLQPVEIVEPSIAETVAILKNLRPLYERYHGVCIDDEALEAAAELSKRYITGRFLPDKALDLIDEAGSQRQIASSSTDDATPNSPTVTRSHVGAIVSSWTGIPVGKLLQGEARKLIAMEDRLRERIVGQDEAVEAVANTIRAARAGMQDPNRPLGSLLFLGPTGVGKTELARALADFLFDDEGALLRIDMSEFQEPHTISRLIGAPPGYVGYEAAGQLTDAVRRRPYCVVLLDEVEKGHPDVLDLLLQVLDHGRLSDSHARVVDFRNTIVVMTSNVGSRLLSPTSLETSQHSWASRRDEVMSEVRKVFRPELLNRLGEIVVFRPLSRADMSRIVDIQLRLVSARLAAQGIQMVVSLEAKAVLARTGFSPAYGARPLQRAIEHLLIQPLAIRFLRGDVNPGSQVHVEAETDAAGERLTFRLG